MILPFFVRNYHESRLYGVFTSFFRVDALFMHFLKTPQQKMASVFSLHAPNKNHPLITRPPNFNSTSAI